MVREWASWLAALALATASLLAARPALDKAHVVLVYLLLVLAASGRASRAIGLSMSVAAFLCVNFFFVPPYHTLHVGDPLDWLVLIAFLATSLVAAHLLARARAEAAVARRRADEMERLSAVGAEALNAGRAEEALAAIATVIGTTLGIARCEIHVRREAGREVWLAAAHGAAETAEEGAPVAGADPAAPAFRLPAGPQLVEWVAGSGRAVVERVDGSTRVATEQEGGASSPALALDLAGARIALLPLRVGGRTVGVLRLAAAGALALDDARRRFLDALAYYAALGVERLRLVGEAEHVDALRAADALKDALLASVSHDLRTPLTTIKALANAIRLEGDERAATIEEEADRLNRFVADLLDLSRLAGGALVVNADINAADDLIGVALQRVAGASTGREIRVRLDAAEPLLLGRFDFVHSLRIVVNLLENALKYAPAPAPIEVHAWRAGSMLHVAVADRGPGVPEADAGRIFEAFYRPAGRLPDAGGAGLGLSIARQLAEAQGGTLRHEPRPGGGSRFVLALPAVDLDALREAAGSL